MDSEKDYSHRTRRQLRRYEAAVCEDDDGNDLAHHRWIIPIAARV